MQKSNLIGICMLLLCSFIWGSAFVAQSVGAQMLPPFTFNGTRSLLAAVFLIPCIALLDKLAGKDLSVWGTDETHQRQDLLTGGVLCGIILGLASTLQQIGIGLTSVGKAGFITALYIIIVPLLGYMFNKHVTKQQWLGVVLAAIGMYFICITENFSVNKGDMVVFGCSIVFAIHILVIARFAPLVDCVRMSALQFFVCGICSLPFILIGEQPSLSSIASAWVPIAYAGILSSGVAYTLQIVGQKRVNEVIASLLLSLESVFSVLSGWFFLGQALSLREISGCALVFLAIILAQIPSRK